MEQERLVVVCTAFAEGVPASDTRLTVDDAPVVIVRVSMKVDVRTMTRWDMVHTPTHCQFQALNQTSQHEA